MERLTERDEYGNADIIALSDMMPEIYAELSFSETNALTDALNRLAAYEDAGMEPGEIAELLRKEANEPLTVGELQEMAFGKWVWIQSLILSPANDIVTGYYRKMDGYRPEDAFYFGYPEYEEVGHTAWGPFADYGKTWLAYRRKKGGVVMVTTKFCPLTARPCKERTCAWWCKGAKVCAVLYLAEPFGVDDGGSEDDYQTEEPIP